MTASFLFNSSEGLPRGEGVVAAVLPYGLMERDRTLPVDGGAGKEGPSVKKDT
jgi:hypothetical protein